MKKRLLSIIFAFSIIFQLISCFEDFATPERYSSSFIGKERNSFWVITKMKNQEYKSNPSGWKHISVEKIKDDDENSKVVIYLDIKEKSKKSIDELKKLAKDFNDNIYETVTDKFAKSFDIDENGKTIIVLTDLPGMVSGYFFNLDLYNNRYIQKYNEQSGTCLKSNEGDIIFVDVNLPKKQLHGTAAHEFMHLVSGSHSILNGQDPLDTWIEEGLAEAANHLYSGEIIRDRVRNFNLYQSINQVGYPLFKWESKLIDYSLSYLFFQFLRHHSLNEDVLFKNIISSPYTDYNAIIDAMNQDGNLKKWGSSGVERFKMLLLRFYATNAGVEGPNYGYDDVFYKSKDGLKDSTYSYRENNSVILESGASVAVDMTEKLTNFSNKCIYLSVDNNVEVVDGEVIGEDFTGFEIKDKLIAVNFDYKTDSKILVTLPENKNQTDNQTEESSRLYSRNKSIFYGNEKLPIDFINSRELIKELNEIELSE